MAEHTPLPWTYRPYKHDDWGWIRGPVMEGEQIGELVAKAHCWATEEEKDAHRRDKTDPYAANAAFIVKAVNNHEALVNAIEAIKKATIDGRVCDDVAWFDENTTLHDFCDQVLAVVGGSPK